MTKSVKVKIILIISFLTLSALIMTYRYFADFRQTQIDREAEQKPDLSSPINQFEFAQEQEQESLQENTLNDKGIISTIDLDKDTFLNIEYSTQPFITVQNAQEIAEQIIAYGKDPVIQNFIKDMDKAIGKEGPFSGPLPSIEEIQKQLNSTQTQKILLQYSKDPAFKQAMQKVLQDPAFMTGFIKYIQNQPEQTSSK